MLLAKIKMTTRVALVDLPNPCRIDVTDIGVDQIRTRVRLRTPDEDKIKELSESIRISGLINPITIDNQNYLIAGFHRWNACKQLGWSTIPAIIKDVSSVHRR